VFRTKARLVAWIRASHSDTLAPIGNLDLAPRKKGVTGWAALGTETIHLAACTVFRGHWRYEIRCTMPSRPLPGIRTSRATALPIATKPEWSRPLTTCGTANSY
jgi:hypothetical protein